MTIEYNWTVSQMVIKPEEGNLSNVVVTVDWKRDATVVVGDKTYTAGTHGQMDCPAPSETNFTAYSDLTFENVCEWLTNGLDMQTIDLALEQMIENQINPPAPSTIVLPNPWN